MKKIKMTNLFTTTNNKENSLFVRS